MLAHAPCAVEGPFGNVDRTRFGGIGAKPDIRRAKAIGRAEPCKAGFGFGAAFLCGIDQAAEGEINAGLMLDLACKENVGVFAVQAGADGKVGLRCGVQHLAEAERRAPAQAVLPGPCYAIGKAAATFAAVGGRKA